MSEYITITWWDYKLACFIVGGICMAVGLFIGELKHNPEGVKKKINKFMESIDQ
ncbi:hypothetical protein MettiDRAFT_0006 [Methanolobus tindarius DSM 2278]|uniref:Uncharacterized protein n=1 Tax=Methanolobus tindarius DSM 2278 TaxID=1090322 RepID=W9DMB2_METTI|nr:hypothetical protein [Methanolobus tindarius]ETA66609.1 hypothetical protein MettiDRAFT_0006 [Methanolobus tindarius DSM 2278]